MINGGFVPLPAHQRPPQISHTPSDKRRCAYTQSRAHTSRGAIVSAAGGTGGRSVIRSTSPSSGAIGTNRHSNITPRSHGSSARLTGVASAAQHAAPAVRISLAAQLTVARMCVVFPHTFSFDGAHQVAGHRGQLRRSSSPVVLTARRDVEMPVMTANRAVVRTVAALCLVAVTDHRGRVAASQCGRAEHPPPGVVVHQQLKVRVGVVPLPATELCRIPHGLSVHTTVLGHARGDRTVQGCRRRREEA